MKTKELYRKLLNASSHVFGMAFTKQLESRIRFHRKLNLKNPQTLADKISYQELFVENPLKIKCSSKSEVREYIAEKGLSRILVPLCYETCDSVDQIDFEKLPNQFAMKAAHGCEMNLICKDKKEITEKELYSLAAKWLKEDYPRACIEPHYKKIPHRIIFEEFLQDTESIVDYKFHCFHGTPDFVLVCSNRVSGLQLKLYTLNWEPIDEIIGSHKGTHEFERPENLSEMIEICKILASDFDFVRVDLYDIAGKIYFGELTFSPATGVLPYLSEKFITEKGKLLHLYYHV